MTQQYLIGELSQYLARLQAEVTDPVSAGDAARLRRQAETWPLAAIGAITERSLELVSRVCWESLTRGDIRAFNRQADVGAELHQFGAEACLLDDCDADTRVGGR